MTRIKLTVSLLLTALVLTGCETVYYQTMDSFGYPKREILVDRVEDARDTQEKAKDEFVDALSAFTAVVEMDGGDLEYNYRVLEGRLSDCQSRATAVRTRIQRVESVGNALFDEWENELDLYSSQDIRQASTQRLRESRRQFDTMLKQMWRAEESMQPVLAAFRDQVLYLKHNLNARAVASLRNELISVRQDVDGLVREMEVAISEADQFIRTL